MARSRFVRPGAVVVLVAVLGFAGPIVQPAAASVTERYESSTMAWANTVRSRTELSELLPSACLQRFADTQARQMGERHRIYHQNLDVILDRCGLREAGENVAVGYWSGQQVTRAWLDSPSHRSNLLNRAHDRIGVGAYRDSRGDWYVSQVMGREL